MTARKVPIPTPDDLEPVDDRPMPSNVIAALARVEAEIGGIEKRRGNAESGGGLNYAFRGIDVVTSQAQPLFGRYGIVIVPAIESHVVDEITVNGKPWTDSTVTVRWSIFGPGGVGDRIEAVTVGLGRDNSDKGYPKAMTQAYKNLLLRVLMIGDPADDADGHTFERDQRRPAPVADPEVDAVLARLKKLGTEHPDEAATIKLWAHGQEQSLSGSALRDGDWRDEVVKMLDELDDDRQPEQIVMVEGGTDGSTT